MIYPTRSSLVQLLSPAPKRHVQALIRKLGLRTGLDIGCGKGSLLSPLRSADFQSTGLDADPQSLRASMQSGSHDHYIEGDLRTLPLKPQYDVVVLSHVIEHFTRDEGLELLKKVEGLATRIVYVETPHGFYEMKAPSDRHLERHLSGWFPQDFVARGYVVYGCGPLWLADDTGARPPWAYALTNSYARAMQRYYFRRPQKAATIAAIRYTDAVGNFCKV